MIILCRYSYICSCCGQLTKHNELPLSLGIKDIRLGPTLPAFISPAVLNFLVATFGIRPIAATHEEDLQAILG